MLKRLYSVAFVVLILSIPVRSDDWDKKFDITGTPQLSVRAGDGHVNVKTWDQRQIAAHVTTKGWRIADDEVRVVATQTADRVDIEIHVPRQNWQWHSGRRSIQVELTIPREATLGVHTSDGHISVASLKGAIDLETSDGHVTATDLRGDIRIKTSDGHIEATGLDGKLDARTSDGGIRVKGRFDALNLSTSDGSISANVLAGSKITTSWSLSTSDGNVELSVPDTLNADVDARTADGHITSDLPITVSGEVGRSKLRGRLNAGGPTIQLKTQDGHIHISRS
ncbi:MAG: DUF4097 family beta strand repeat protein [Acidobacteria bacterium]|nr:DUF4097 family beta strand repeat protein [Acidobacteriota bacterium]